MPRARRSLTLTLEGGRGRRGSPPRVGLLRRRCSAPACGGTLRSGDTSRPPIQAGIRPRRRGRSAFIGPSGATPSGPARPRRLALHYAPTVFEHQTSAGAAETELISRRVLLHSLFRTKGSRRCPVYVPTECPCWTRGSRRCPVDAPAECRCPYWTRGSRRCRAGRTGTLPLRAPPTSVAVSHCCCFPVLRSPFLIALPRRFGHQRGPRIVVQRGLPRSASDAGPDAARFAGRKLRTSTAPRTISASDDA